MFSKKAPFYIACVVMFSCNKHIDNTTVYTDSISNPPTVIEEDESKQNVMLKDSITNDTLTDLEKKGFRILNDSAITLYKNDKAFEGYLMMNTSIRINPNYADSYYIRGLISQTAFNLFYGKPDFEKALELNPKHVDALLKLAIICGKDGDKPLACQYLKKACDLGNSDGCEGYTRFCNKN